MPLCHGGCLMLLLLLLLASRRHPTDQTSSATAKTVSALKAHLIGVRPHA
jgi:hypothetical protein